MPALDLTCARTHTHLVRDIYSPSRSASITHTHTQVAVYWRCGWWWHTPIPMPTLDCLHKHIFLLHVYRSFFLSRMLRYTQLGDIFHQCASSVLSRDGRIGCTVRHRAWRCPFSSFSNIYCVGSLTVSVICWARSLRLIFCCCHCILFHSYNFVFFLHLSHLCSDNIDFFCSTFGNLMFVTWMGRFHNFLPTPFLFVHADLDANSFLLCQCWL